MSVKVTNNAFATLAADTPANSTTITVTAGQGARFPVLTAVDYFYATIVNTLNVLEIVKVTGRNADILTVTRAIYGSAQAWKAGDRIELRPTAELFNDKLDTADAAATYATKSYSDATYLMKNGGGAVTFLQVQAPAAQLQINDTSASALNGRFRWISAGGSLILQRNTAGGGDFATSATPLWFNGTSDVAAFSQRPYFNGATPWDSANLTPLDKNLGGVVGGAMQFNSGVVMASAAQVNADFHVYGSNTVAHGNAQVAGELQVNTNVVSTNGNYYFDAGHQRYLAQSGGNLFIGGFGEAYINGNRVLHVGNGLSDMTNNVGFINSIAVAAPRIASSDSSGTLTNVGLEMVDARTIRLVLSFVNSSGGGGQGG